MGRSTAEERDNAGDATREEVEVLIEKENTEADNERQSQPQPFNEAPFGAVNHV